MALARLALGHAHLAPLPIWAMGVTISLVLMLLLSPNEMQWVHEVASLSQLLP